MTAKIIYSNGKEVDVEPENGKDFKLAEMQKIVGGLIEIIYLDNNQIMIVNEEGKLENLPLNQKATNIANNNHIIDLIVGDVLICDSKMVK
jgi:hypothetical protein